MSSSCQSPPSPASARPASPPRRARIAPAWTPLLLAAVCLAWLSAGSARAATGCSPFSRSDAPLDADGQPVKQARPARTAPPATPAAQPVTAQPKGVNAPPLAAAPIPAARPVLPPAPTPRPAPAAVPPPVPVPIAARPLPADGPHFRVTQFVFEYGRNLTHPGLPALTTLDDLEVSLGLTDEGYVAAREGAETVRLRLGDLPLAGQQEFYASAILQVNLAVVNHFVERCRLVGVYICPHPEDILEQRVVRPGGALSASFEDRRGARTTLREVVMVGIVSDVRTVASGERVRESQRINNPVHERILRDAPVAPAPAYRALLLAPSVFARDSFRRERRVDAPSGRPYTAVVGTIQGSTEPAEQSLEYPATIWGPQQAQAHALAAGAAWQEAAPASRHDLLNKDALDSYVCWLSRHPGRRVDLAVAASGERPGDVGLDFLIAESKPWLAYTQYSNTGTRATDTDRLRFGFIHNQFTNNDDILSLDYSTACFDDSQAFIGSYSAPVSGLDRLRWEAHANWHQFDATQIGAGDADISGDGWTAGGDLVVNVLQRGDFFLDALAGAEWRHIEATNPDFSLSATGDSARADYLVPHVGLRAERVREISALNAEASFEWNQPGVSGADRQERQVFGREETDSNWHLWQGSAAYSCFLEPLLAPAAWQDPCSRWATLAHEVMLGGAWQYAGDKRLIPNNRMVAGGLYSVRGYPESVVAGDTAFFAQTEYRFHVPRAVNPRRAKEQGPGGKTLDLWGRRFRYLPQHPYGRADWDLILRAFFDVGRTLNTDRMVGEYNETLAGAGLGAELKLYQNVSLRLDWGVPLISTNDGEADAGVSRVRVVVTLVY